MTAESEGFYFTMNATELLYLVRCQTGLVVKRSVDRARLIEMVVGTHQQQQDPTVRQQAYPRAEELAASNDSRQKLQVFIEKNWEGVQSQLPCKGENRGRCTIYPCPEARHFDCLISAAPHMKMHGLQS